MKRCNLYLEPSRRISSSGFWSKRIVIAWPSTRGRTPTRIGDAARNLLEHLDPSTTLTAFTALADRLNKKLGLEPSNLAVPAGSALRSNWVAQTPAQSVSPRLNAYLMGIAAECDFEVPLAEVPRREPTHLDADRLIEPAPANLPFSDRHRAIRALYHYRELLAVRPDSYWGHYRAAGACYLLGSFRETTEHLDRCLELRPDNPALRGYRAACLAWLDRYPEALQECNVALAGAPDLAELYRTRAFIRAASGQTTGLAADLRHFELLSHQLPRGLLTHETTFETGEPHSPPSATERRIAEFPKRLDFQSHFVDRIGLSAGSMEGVTIDPSELNTRYMLASTIRKSGEQAIASGEYAKILILDPDHIPARMTRALEAINGRHFAQAECDFDALLSHPQLLEYLRRDPTLLLCFHQASHRLSLGGKVEEGRALARKALDLANALKQYRAESHYNLARAYAICAKRPPTHRPNCRPSLVRIRLKSFVSKLLCSGFHV